jgi:hypothetical protein
LADPGWCLAASGSRCEETELACSVHGVGAGGLTDEDLALFASTETSSES